ncbi:MAG: hypothetical protein LBU79_06320 [Planctomycetota bacterium]|jgi:hypothetical protein|nr:hypothetical protein [Planctomycetota bacterium]
MDSETEAEDVTAARFLGDALTSHARQIRGYAKRFPEVLATLPSELATKGWSLYLRNVTSRVREMQSLMLMAAQRQVTHYCNCELVEAYLDDALSVAIAMVDGKAGNDAFQPTPLVLN